MAQPTKHPLAPSIPRQVLALALWPWLEQLMAFLVGTVDLALAGHLADESTQVAATDALGTTTYITWLLQMIHTAVGIGAAAIIARAIGAKHKSLANAALGQSMLVAAINGTAIAALLYFAAPYIGTLLADLDPQALNLATLYLQIVAAAVPASAILLVGAAALRAAGDTRTPFFVMIAVNIVNVAASYIFVFGPEPFGGHGVTGIAAGTVLAWITGALIILTILLRQNAAVRLHRHRITPHLHTLKRITKVAFPAMLESILGMWLANALVLRIVGSIDTPGIVGAHMIAIRTESLSFLSGYALATAAGTLTGQYLGAKDPKRARQAATTAWAYGSAIMIPLGLFFYLFPDFFSGIITPSQHLQSLAHDPIRICGPIQIFFASQMICSGALRGAGDTRAAMWMTTTSNFLIRVPAVYIMAVYFDYGLTGIWFALCGELVLRGTIFAARFLNNAWTKIQV